MIKNTLYDLIFFSSFLHSCSLQIRTKRFMFAPTQGWDVPTIEWPLLHGTLNGCRSRDVRETGRLFSDHFRNQQHTRIELK